MTKFWLHIHYIFITFLLHSLITMM